MSSCHRCIDCRLTEEHEPDEICPSCGRCAVHCQGGNHQHMERVEAPDDA